MNHWEAGHGNTSENQLPGKRPQRGAQPPDRRACRGAREGLRPDDRLPRHGPGAATATAACSRVHIHMQPCRAASTSTSITRRSADKRFADPQFAVNDAFRRAKRLTQGPCQQAARRREDPARAHRPHARPAARGQDVLAARAASLHALLVEPLAQQADAVAAPEQLAVEDERRHAENARGLGLAAQPVVLGAALADQEVRRSPAARRPRSAAPRPPRRPPDRTRAARSGRRRDRCSGGRRRASGHRASRHWPAARRRSSSVPSG